MRGPALSNWLAVPFCARLFRNRMDKQQAIRLVYETIDQINPQLAAARRLPKSAGTVLVGPGGSLDSLGLITFVVALEERVGDTLARSVQLLDETALSDPTGPFHTVDTLADYVAALPGV